MDTAGLFESFGDLEVLAGRLDDARRLRRGAWR